MYNHTLAALAGTGVERDPVLSAILALLDAEFETEWRPGFDLAETAINHPEYTPVAWLGARAEHLSAPPALTPGEHEARKKVAAARTIVRMKGTLRGLELSLKLMRCTSVTVTPVRTSFGLDSPIRLDDPVRRLDSKRCHFCYTVDIEVAGPQLPADPTAEAQFLNAVAQVVYWHLPIFTRIRNLSYNGNTYVPPVYDGAFNADFTNVTEYY